MSRTSLSDREADSILFTNRSKFKKIFTKHLPSREGKIPIQEFIKFCQNVKILPVIEIQDLITPIDLKKIISQLSLKLQITYLEFEMLVKQIALQTFNNTAPLFDKIRMLLIHIRNSCKMHYQVSLSQNFNKEALDFETMQDPVEIEPHQEEIARPVQKLFKKVYASISPLRDNDGQKTRVPRKSDKGASPTSSAEILKKGFGYKFSIKSNRNSKVLNENKRRISASPFRSVSPADPAKLAEVKKSFEVFRNKFQDTVKTPPRTFTAKRVSAQLSFIKRVRSNVFSSKFVLSLIFSSWKQAAQLRLLSTGQ